MRQELDPMDKLKLMFPEVDKKHEFIRRMGNLIVRCNHCSLEFTKHQLRSMTVSEAWEVQNEECPSRKGSEEAS